MRIIILGAGEVGKGLASTLCMEKNDVVMVDTNEKLLAELSDTMDIMSFTGNGTWPITLEQVGISEAHLFIAVTSFTETNILACTVAKQLNSNVRTVARVGNADFFPSHLPIEPKSLGIDHIVIPQIECSEAVLEVLGKATVKEIVHLSVPGAVICGFQINPGSPMIGAQLSNFPRKDFLEKIRICAIWRRGRLIIPRGSERFNNYDEIYVAGDQKDTDQFIDWATVDEHQLKHAIIVSASHFGLSLAKKLADLGVTVSLIEPDLKLAETVLDNVNKNITLFNADATSTEVLTEAGVENCDAFISALKEDERNVLCTLMAKRLGARKVIPIINKIDYREIISSMEKIDCCFSPRIAALNSIINLVKGSDRRIGALLQRVSAEIFDMTISPNSKIAGRSIKENLCPPEAVFAMILRGNVIIPAVGNEVFQVGDRVVMMGSTNAMKACEDLFTKKSFFNL